jgi:uncharacterized protein (TIGR02246 family)
MTGEADELAIRNLIARVAHLADHGDIDQYVMLFTEDASWEFPAGPRRGRADIRAGAQQRRAEGQTGPGTSTRHVITTMAVSLVDELTATVDSYFIFYRDTTTNPTVFNMGHYHDTVRREDGEWRLDRRVITIG